MNLVSQSFDNNKPKSNSRSQELLQALQTFTSLLESIDVLAECKTSEAFANLTMLCAVELEGWVVELMSKWTRLFVLEKDKRVYLANGNGGNPESQCDEPTCSVRI